MGLIKSVFGSIGGTLADTWKEEFYADSLENNVLVVKGKKKISGRTSNIKGEDNVITTGSGVIVNDGQCALIVEQGKVVDVCSEVGEYKYDNTIAPSLFCGNLGEGIGETFKTIGKRIGYGGDTGIDQRIYYFNIKELLNNRFGTIKPVPFRIVDQRINLDIDVSIRCFGTYSFKIIDPLLFYKNVCGNVTEDYKIENIEEQLKREFSSALQPAFGKISALGIRPSEIVNHSKELEIAMNEALDKQWIELRGIKVVSLAIGSITLPDEDQEIIKQAQRAIMLKDPNFAGATLIGAQADAMRMAASNPNGAIAGFMGMGMAMNNGSAQVAQNLFAMGNQMMQQPISQENKDTWTCKCGQVNTGNFCQNCGSKKI